MLARSRQITLRNGIHVSTPLLIPSLSSGALGPIPYQALPAGKPEMTTCSIVHTLHLIGGIEESLLISAYDIKHGLVADADAFKSGFNNSRYAQPRVLVIDSGWYEKNGSPPGSPFAKDVGEPRPWEEADYTSVIDSLDKDIRSIVVSWDHIGPYDEQIQRAQNFFGSRGHLASVLLLKPPAGSRFHHFDKLSGEHIGTLRPFDIVGITERELGESIVDRLVNVAKLRELLNAGGVSPPIHIFGGLDPLFTPLYFAAGAEIFDSLGWLRYAYREGVAMHWTAATLFGGQIQRRSLQAQLSVALQNLDEINRLTEDMRRFVYRRGDWGAFSRGDDLKPIFESLQERLGA